MMEKGRILITGANGNVGSEIIKLLDCSSLSIRAAGLDCEKIRKKFGSTVEPIRLDFTNQTTYKAALEGVTKIFLMRPPAITNIKQHIAPFISAAIASGVKHIVFLSLQGVEHNKFVPHYKIEQAILSSKVSYTFLRAGFFMQNLATTHREDIRTSGDIFIPAGRGKTAFIDVRDIAAVATKALTEQEHLNKAYDLTGGSALDYYQVAKTFSSVLEKTITYSNPSAISFYLRMRKRSIPRSFVLVMIALYTICRIGKAGTLTNKTRELLNRDPISLEQFIEDYREIWM